MLKILIMILNMIELGDKEELLESNVVAGDINYISRSGTKKINEMVLAKIRYNVELLPHILEADNNIINRSSLILKIQYSRAMWLFYMMNTDMFLHMKLSRKN